MNKSGIGHNVDQQVVINGSDGFKQVVIEGPQALGHVEINSFNIYD